MATEEEKKEESSNEEAKIAEIVGDQDAFTITLTIDGEDIDVPQELNVENFQEIALNQAITSISTVEGSNSLILNFESGESIILVNFFGSVAKTINLTFSDSQSFTLSSTDNLWFDQQGNIQTSSIDPITLFSPINTTNETTPEFTTRETSTNNDFTPPETVEPTIINVEPDPPIQEVNSTPPTITSTAFSINEDIADTNNIGTVTFIGDGAATFAINNDPDNLFEINASTGEISLQTGKILDFETQTSHTIEVSVNDGSSTSATQDITINVNDINDNAPGVTTTDFAADENIIDSATIGTVTFTDVDTTNGTTVYAITADADNLFEIDPATGVVSLQAGKNLDYENKTSHTITVAVNDGIHTSATQDITITVNNNLADADSFIHNVGDVFQSIDGGADNDILTINGDGTDAYLIEDAATYNARTTGTDYAADHFLVSINGTLAIDAVNIETLNLNLDTGDSLEINGDFDSTTLAAQPFVLDGTESPTLDIDGITSNHGVINILGTGNADNITGGSGADDISAFSAADIITGGKGDDILRGNGGDDTFIYNVGDGFDTIIGGGSTDTVIINGDGTDTYLIESAATYNARTGSSIGSSTFLISINGTLAINAVTTEKINLNLDTGDTLEINGDFSSTPLISQPFILDATESPTVDIDGITSDHGVINIQGSINADTITGGSGDDTIYGNEHNDILNGGDGDDTIYGGVWSDTINGGNGNDTIYGEFGNEIIDGGSGNDTIDGGSGNDTITYTVGDGIDTVDGGGDSDTLIINGDTGTQNDIVLTEAAGHLIITINGSQVIDAVNIENLTINLGTSSDTISYGDLSATGLVVNGITVNSTTGNDNIVIDGAVGYSPSVTDFDDGAGNPDLEGWTIISQNNSGSGPKILVSNQAQNGGQDVPLLTTRSDTDGGAFSGDDAHDLLVARSETFQIGSTSPLTFIGSGGGTSSAPALGSGAYQVGDLGVSLVRASDGVRVLTVNTSSNGTALSYSLDTSAYANDGLDYYVEVVDYDSGSWGFVELDDFVLPTSQGSHSLTFNGSDGIDTIITTELADSINAGAGDDVINGLNGDDTIDAGSGNDSITYEIGDGTDTIDGGADVDTLIINNNSGDSKIFLVEDAATYNARTGGSLTAGHVAISADGSLIIDALNIENITFNMGENADKVFFGDLSATDIATDGITINGTSGANDLFSSGSISTFSDSFGNADWQDWTVISQNNSGSGPKILVGSSEVNRLSDAPAITTRSDTDGGIFNGDDAHTALVARSATFQISSSDSITFESVGGLSGSTNAPALSAAAYQAGDVGVSLVRASDGVRVLALNTSSNGAVASYSMDTSAFLDDGIDYYLEVVDFYSGSWGFAEWDNFIIPSSSSHAVTLNGGVHNDTLNGTDNADVINGDDGIDTINGGAGNDTIDAGNSNDTINYFVGDGFDTIDGGDSGGDNINIYGDSGSTNTFLIEDAATYNANNGGTDLTIGHLAISINGTLAMDITNIELLSLHMGTVNDSITFNGDISLTDAAQFFITPTAGDDNPTINTAGLLNSGGITIWGSAGNDTLNGSDRVDTIYGDAGDDILSGLDGADTINGGDDNDTIYGDIWHREDFENGATGWNDNTTTDAGTNLTNFLGRFAGSGGAEDISKTFNLPSTTAVTFSFDVYELDSWDNEEFNIFIDGVEIITTNWYVFDDDEVYSGTSGDISWTITPGSRDNYAFSSYNDQIHSVSITITNPNSTVKLGFGSTLNGSGNDESWGIDNLVISTGSADGNDTINGDAGDDTIYGDGGDDTIDGGTGNDTIAYTVGDGFDTVDGGDDNDALSISTDGSDTILIEDAATYNARTTGTDYAADHFLISINGVLAIDAVNIENINLNSKSSDTVEINGDFSSTTLSSTPFNINSIQPTLDIDGITSDHGVVITGSSGNDSITGSQGGDTINAGSGNDTITYTAGTDTIDGESGTDTVVINGDGTDTILIEDAATYNTRTTSSIADGHILVTINGVLSIDAVNVEILNINADTGDTVTINGNFSSTTLTAQPFVLDGSQAPTLDIDGITSDHGVLNISGTAGVDTITGGAGSDVIDTGTGDDTIDGGAGNDSISYNVGDGFDTVNGGDNTDALTINGDGTDVYLIEDAATYNARTTGTDYAADHFLVSINGVLAIDAVNIEIININADTGDTVEINGDFDNTTLSAEPFVFDPAEGPTLDIDGITSAHQAVNVQFIGTAGADTINGDSGDNIINGAAGDDTIDGAAGDDTIDAGADDDTITYNVGEGFDTVDGNTGTDTLVINGDGTDLILVEDAATYNARTGGSLAADHFAVSINGVLAVDAVNIETVNLNTDTGDTLTIDGDFSNTTLSSQAFVLDDSVDNANYQNGLWYGTADGYRNTTTSNPKTSLTTDLSETEDSIVGTSTEIYTGEIYDADGHISFTEHIDDGAMLYIDGQLVLDDSNWNARTSTADLNLTPGWHTFELRISNNGGGSGPRAVPGFGYDPDGGTNWSHPSDPGDGTLFRSMAVDIDGITSDHGVINICGTVGVDTFYVGGSGDDIINGESGNDTIMTGDGDDTINYTVGGGVDTVDGGGDSDTLVFNGAGNDTILIESATVYNARTGGSITSDHFLISVNTVLSVDAVNIEHLTINAGAGDDIVIDGDFDSTTLATDPFTINYPEPIVLIDHTFDEGTGTLNGTAVDSGTLQTGSLAWVTDTDTEFNANGGIDTTSLQSAYIDLGSAITMGSETDTYELKVVIDNTSGLALNQFLSVGFWDSIPNVNLNHDGNLGTAWWFWRGKGEFKGNTGTNYTAGDISDTNISSADGSEIFTTVLDLTDPDLTNGTVSIYYGDAATGILLGTANFSGEEDFSYVGFGAKYGTVTDHATADIQSFTLTKDVDVPTIDSSSLTSTHGMTINGSSYDDTLTGSANVDTISGDAGNDNISNGAGADVLDGGAGNDIFSLTTSDFFSIDGGLDLDSIILGTGVDLDLSPGASRRVENIEIIDLVSGNGANTLTLDYEDILDLVSARDFGDDIIGGNSSDDATSDILRINGDADDNVDLTDFTDQVQTVTVDSITYDLYTSNSDTDADILIEQGINII